MTSLAIFKLVTVCTVLQLVEKFPRLLLTGPSAQFFTHRRRRHRRTQRHSFRLLPTNRVIDRASKRGSGTGGASSAEMCVAGRPVSDKVFFWGALGVFLAGSLASWGRVYALAMASGGVAGRLRTRLFAALLLQEKEFFDAKKAGELAPILAEVMM